MYKIAASFLLSIAYILGITLFLLTTKLEAYAQVGATTANISGTILNEEGKTINGAKITAISGFTRASSEVVSNEAGGYILFYLTPGPYQVKVTAEGYGTQVFPILLELGTERQLDFTLKANEIEKSQPNVKDLQVGTTENRAYIDRVSQKGLVSFPINQRNFTTFTLTTPRASLDRLPLGGTIIATSRISFNGQPARFNALLVDGLDAYNRASGSIGPPNFIQGSIQEVQILSDNYSAEFGRSAGGVISAVTRSGSNEFRGGIFNFTSSDNLAARDPFGFRKDFEQYQSGIALSGPIKKNKIFYFLAAGRASVKQESVVFINDETVKQARNLGIPFSNGPVPFTIGATAAFLRIDAQLTPKNKSFIRYNGNFVYNDGHAPFGDRASNTTGLIQQLKENSIAISNTYSGESGRLVNETRVLLGQRYDNATEIQPGTPLIGIQDIFPVNPNDKVLVSDFGGLAAFGGNVLLPQPMQARPRVILTQFTNNISYVKGIHEFKFGVDFASFALNARRLGLFENGQALFVQSQLSADSPEFTGSQLFNPALRTPQQRAFLIDYANRVLPSMGLRKIPLADIPLPNAYLQAFGPQSANQLYTLFSSFIQDTIKLRPNFLIKAGIRYDRNRYRYVAPNQGFFSPRVSLSYRPSFADKLTVTAGYGLYVAAPVVAPTIATFLLRDKGLRIFVLPFPQSVYPFLEPNHNLPASLSTDYPDIPYFIGLGTTVDYDANLRDSYTQQASLALTYAVNKNTDLSINYIYVRGNRLFSARNSNPIRREIPNDPLGSQLMGREDPTKPEVILTASAYDSYYHGMTVALNKRFANKFSLTAHYTLSKTIDNFVDFTANIRNDPLDLATERALSSQDVRHRFIATAVWNLDYTKNRFLSGFQVAPIVTLESGRTYNLAQQVSLLTSRGGLFRPNFRFNSLGRNVGVTPYFANMDIRITKNMPFKKRYNFQVTLDIFNVFNKLNVNFVNGNILPDSKGVFTPPPKTGKRFGSIPSQYRTAFPSRAMQVGLAFSF